VGALVERKERMVIPWEVITRFVDVAERVANTHTDVQTSFQNIAEMRTKTDEWTEIFDRAYGAIKATVVEEKGKD